VRSEEAIVFGITIRSYVFGRLAGIVLLRSATFFDIVSSRSPFLLSRRTVQHSCRFLHPVAEYYMAIFIAPSIMFSMKPLNADIYDLAPPVFDVLIC
jgi:hypothetical protein